VHGDLFLGEGEQTVLQLVVEDDVEGVGLRAQLHVDVQQGEGVDQRVLELRDALHRGLVEHRVEVELEVLLQFCSVPG
jgi:hypothetical protein